VNSGNGSVHDQKLQPMNGATPLLAPCGFPQYVGSHSIGHDLSPADIRMLEMRWIDPDLARRADLRRVDSLTAPRSSAERAATIPASILRPATDW
jgi:hypothetical protein